MLLFRPTGLRELRLVLERDLAGWPARLPDQPIFYPVTNVAYAEQIAREWNTKSELRAGYVTEFEVDDAYASQFERKVVGNRTHEELWVPAEQLADFNRHILGKIRVLSAFFGDNFAGLIPTGGDLRGKVAREQLSVLAGQFASSVQDFQREITQNRDAVFLHLPYWRQLELAETDLPAPRDAVLDAVERVWEGTFPDLPLPARRR